MVLLHDKSCSQGKLRHHSTETAYPQADKPHEVKDVATSLTLLQHPVTLNHLVRDAHHLRHSHLRLTAVICPSHYGTVTRYCKSCKGHNSSCSSFLPHMLIRAGKKEKNKLAVLSRQKKSIQTFSLMSAIFCFFFFFKKKEKFDKIIVLLLLVFSSTSQFTDFGYL